MLQLNSHLFASDSLAQLSLPVDSTSSIPPEIVNATITTDTTEASSTWDFTTTPDLFGADSSNSAALFACNNNTTQPPPPPTAHCPRTTKCDGPVAIDSLPTPESSVTDHRRSSTADTGPSPHRTRPEWGHEAPKSPASESSLTESGVGVGSGRGWLSPLHIAAKKGSARIIRMLLQHNGVCDEPDSEGLTPLMYAVMGGHEEATLSLLDHGARIEVHPRDAGAGAGAGERPRSSAIHCAVRHRRERVLRILLDRCPDPRLIDGHDHSGRAALHVAIDLEFDAGVSLLLQFGADPSQKAPRH